MVYIHIKHLIKWAYNKVSTIKLKEIGYRCSLWHLIENENPSVSDVLQQAL